MAEIDLELLIAAVQKFPPVFDKEDKLHPNRNFINQAWREIGNELHSFFYYKNTFYKNASLMFELKFRTI